MMSDDETSTQGKVVDGCLSSSSSSAQTRMTDKEIDSKPCTLPPPPCFKNIFVYTKDSFHALFSDSVWSQIAVNTNVVIH
jgi:hypothetical protein